MNRPVLVFLAVAVFCATAGAGSYPLGIGLHSGYDLPVIQDDVGNGPMWGFSVRGNIWNFVHGQLIVRGTSQGDVDEDIDFPNEPTLTLEGGTLTGFGLNVLLGKKDPANIWPYGLLGLSSNSLSPGASFKQDEDNLGFSIGGGLGINLYNRQLYFDVNTTLLVMPIYDDNASRKNWQSMFGLQYFIPIKTK
jgi:hypothetical protein